MLLRDLIISLSFILKDSYLVFAELLLSIFSHIPKSSCYPCWKRHKYVQYLKKVILHKLILTGQFLTSPTFPRFLNHFYINKFITISTSWHGFIRKRLTETDLVVFSQYACESLNEQCQVNTIYMEI